TGYDGAGRTAAMTEAAWLGCTELGTMLFDLRGRLSDRRLRLFAVGCSRRIWHLLTDQRSRQAVQAVERFADGECGIEEVEVAHGLAGRGLGERVGARKVSPVEDLARVISAPSLGAETVAYVPADSTSLSIDSPQGPPGHRRAEGP